MTDLTSATVRHTPTPWNWHPRSEDQFHNGSVFHWKLPGHAYAIAMQPRYVDDAQFAADAALIVEAVNGHENLKARIHELETALDEIARQDDPDLSEQDLRQHDRHAGFSSGLRHCADMARAALSKGAA